MLIRHRSLYSATLAGLLLMLGCQGGGGPQAPESTGAAATPPPTLDAIPPSIWEADLTPGQGLLSAHTLTINPSQLTAHLEPLRTASAIGDSYDVDIYTYLRSSPCSDCLKVTGMSYAGGAVAVNFAAKHPFAFGPARGDLHVFDVRGTLIPLSGTPSPAGFSSVMAGALTPVSGVFGVLQNADGYSSFFTEQVKPYLGSIGQGAQGTIFPYKTFFGDLGPSNYDAANGTFTNLANPAGHNTMKMGSTFADGATTLEIAVLDQPDQELRFLFSLDAAYGASSTRQTRMTPKYYLPEFHRKEAFEAAMEISGGPLVAGNPSSFAQATVTARDWQGDQAADPGFGPTSDAGGLKAASAVSAIQFHIPGVLTGAPQVQLNGVDFSGTVLPGEYWTTYEATFSFTNQAAAPAGTYWAVAAIRDDLYDLTNDPVLAVTRQFTQGQPPQILNDITTYAVAPVVVEDPPSNITFDLNRNPIPADPVRHGNLVQFLIENIDTSPNTLVSVEADPNYCGAPGCFSPSVPTVMINATTYQTQYNWQDPSFLPTPGSPMVFAVRVMDDQANSHIEMVNVQLAANQPPTIAWTGSQPTTGTVGTAVTITAAHVNAADADGTVTGYRISWGDATADHVGALPASHTYAAVSTYTITIFARDNGYGPAAGPAPLPASAESTGASYPITIDPASGIVAPWTEDFELVPDGSLPADWEHVTPANVGTTHRFGVRTAPGTPVLPPGQAKVLEESGFGQTLPGDRNYPNSSPGVLTGAAQAARWGILSPEIQIPNDAFNYELEIVHWTDYNYVSLSGCGGSLGGDGADVGLKSGAVGTLAANESGLVCLRSSNGYNWATGAQWYNPNASSGAGNFHAGLPGGFTGNLVFGRGVNNSCPITNAYVTSRVTLPTALKGQAVRLYFMHGQQQVFSAWNGGGFWALTTRPGWRIDRVSINQIP